MLSDRLTALSRIPKEGDVSLRRLEELFGDDGAPLIILLLCLPFLTPVPIPGISSIFGFAITAFTLRIFKRGRLYLPAFLEKAKIKGEHLQVIAEKGLKIVLRLEKFTKPRASFFFSKVGRIFMAMAMFSSAVALALPIPPIVLFSNSFPAGALGFFSVSLLMRDGLLACVGHVLHLVTWAYFASIAGIAFSFAVELYDRYLKNFSWPF